MSSKAWGSVAVEFFRLGFWGSSDTQVGKLDMLVAILTDLVIERRGREIDGDQTVPGCRHLGLAKASFRLNVVNLCAVAIAKATSP